MNRSKPNACTGWRAALALTTAAAAAVLVACGGGGGGSDTAAATSPATTSTPTTTTPTATASSSYALGPIDGFGSVVVGGVRYDDSKASITDEDGVSVDRSGLKLGVVVQLDAKALNRGLGTAVADRIRLGSEIVGPVGPVDATAGTVVVLGQTVLVTSSTVFDSSLSGGLSALKAGAVIEVHGILDETTGKITATRVESESAATAYKLRGVLAALDGTAKTFRIGSELISYAGIAAAGVPATLANGQVVRVVLNTTQTNGAWVATKLRNGTRAPSGTLDDAHVEGLITAFTSATAFEIGSLKVDASTASFPDGTAGIVLGARVEVKGSVSNGVLVATKVEIEDKPSAGSRPLELHGAITSVDTTARTFVLRGVTVSWAATTLVFKNGSAADLAVARQVEVHGVLSSDRTRLEAQRIEFKS